MDRFALTSADNGLCIVCLAQLSPVHCEVALLNAKGYDGAFKHIAVSLKKADKDGRLKAKEVMS